MYSEGGEVSQILAGAVDSSENILIWPPLIKMLPH